MSLMPTPIATFLSTYGQGLANYFNISSKIPLMCAVTPEGLALGGPGTVGDDEFIANFTEAGGGGDLSKAFDLSGPIPLVCMVNPDGTAYSPVPYTEISFTWTQVGTDAPIIASVNAAPAGLIIDTSYEEAGGYLFSLSQELLTGDGKTEIGSSYIFSSQQRLVGYVVYGTQSIFAYASDLTGAPANVIGNAGYGVYCTTTVRIFPN